MYANLRQESPATVEFLSITIDPSGLFNIPDLVFHTLQSVAVDIQMERVLDLEISSYLMLYLSLEIFHS